MALRVLMLRKKLNEKQQELEVLRAEADGFAARETDLEKAIEEAKTDEEKEAVEEAVTAFEGEREANSAAQSVLVKDIDDIENQIQEIEEAPAPAAAPPDTRKENNIMETRKRFFGMDAEERNAFFANQEVKGFLDRVREAGREKRSISNVGLLIPEVMLELLRENISQYSKLISRVNRRAVSGTARQNIMGSIPEAVWTEMCAKLNELDLSFNNVEVDGYKVGGFMAVCNAILEDSDLALASEIISVLGQAIGLALDKAILYGAGTKMPMGIVTRLAQAVEPDNYSATARPWADLRTTNIITVPAGTTGVALYQEIMRAAAKTMSPYAAGDRFWAMNGATYANLQTEMLSINAAGAIVTGQTMTMPIIGGDVVILDWMPANSIVGGYGQMYLLVERAGMALEQSEHYRFIEDQTVFKGTARYDGVPVIPEAFVSIGLGEAPAAAVTFPPDEANP